MKSRHMGNQPRFIGTPNNSHLYSCLRLTTRRRELQGARILPAWLRLNHGSLRTFPARRARVIIGQFHNTSHLRLRGRYER